MDLHEHRRAAVEWFTYRPAATLDTVVERFEPSPLPAWVVGILWVAVPSQALALWRVYGGLPAGTRPPLRDSIIFEYIGWYLTRGGRLYVDAWELKPPVAYEVTAVVSLLAGGDPVLGHALNVALTVAAAVGAALVAGALVDDLTGDGAAAAAAGIALYVLPAYHWRAAFGFKVKYFVALLALLAVYLARRDRPASAGVAAGLAVGFWQLAAVVPALAVGVAYDHAGRPAARRTLAAAVAVLLVAVAPVAYWGGLEAMVTETVLVPLLIAGELSPTDPLPLAQRILGVALPVAALGAVGVLAGLRYRPRETWWLAGGTAWFAAQAGLLDLDAAPDLFPAMAFLSVGVGLLLGLESGRQRPAALLVAVMAVISVVTMGGFGLSGPMVYEPGPVAADPGLEPTAPYSPAEQAHLYWTRERPETCRVFFGPTQYRLVGVTEKTALAETCGDPGPVFDRLVTKWAGR